MSYVSCVQEVTDRPQVVQKGTVKTRLLTMETNNSPRVTVSEFVFRPRCQSHPFPLSPHNIRRVFIAEGFLHFLLAREILL